MTSDKTSSFDIYITKGEAVIILGINASGQKYQLIAAMLFSADCISVYVN